MKKLYAPFTLASYILYFLLTHLSFFIQETMSLIWTPEAWAAGWGGLSQNRYLHFQHGKPIQKFTPHQKRNEPR